MGGGGGAGAEEEEDAPAPNKGAGDATARPGRAGGVDGAACSVVLARLALRCCKGPGFLLRRLNTTCFKRCFPRAFLRCCSCFNSGNSNFSSSSSKAASKTSSASELPTKDFGSSATVSSKASGIETCLMTKPDGPTSARIGTTCQRVGSVTCSKKTLAGDLKAGPVSNAKGRDRQINQRP